MTPPQPRDRNGFEIAVICALPLEARFVEGVFDKFWEQEGREYGKASGDPNEYTTGVIGDDNVVLAYMPGTGKVNAAVVASNLAMSFTGIKLAIVVGICGGVPLKDDGTEIILGDIIVSNSLIQYDFGRRYPNVFEKKDTLEGNISGPPRAIRAILAKAQTPRNRGLIQQETIEALKSLRSNDSEAKYPDAGMDLLYESSYNHKHRGTAGQDCVCKNEDEICEDARRQSCNELHGDQTKPVTRKRLEPIEGLTGTQPDVQPMIHIGTIGSADTVLKSGEYRDRLAKKDKIIAFEMEGAGVWEMFPSVVVKGVCDYADSHKDKIWQHYAAATAACGMKALLKLRTPEIEVNGSAQDTDPLWYGPTDILPEIFGRDQELHDLQEMLFQTAHRRVAVCGLGGIGKSRLAREIANHAESNDTFSVFWIQASSVASFEKDLVGIGEKLKIPGFDNEKLDRKQLFKQHLEINLAHKHVLFILDSADDEAIWGPQVRQELEPSSLLDYIPKTVTTSLLVTTRSRQIAIYIAKRDVMHLEALEPGKAVEALHSMMIENISHDDPHSSLKLVEKLSCLPLAIVQAAAYINMNNTSIATYLELLSDTQEGEIIELLSKDFEHGDRHASAQNSVASTWLISFKQVQLHHAPAMEYLSFMSCLAEKNIPQFLLPDLASKSERVESIGILRGYSFIQTQYGDDFQASLYSMHRLVRLAIRNWLRHQNCLISQTQTTIIRVNHMLLMAYRDKNETWKPSFPHAQLLCMSTCDENFWPRYLLMGRVASYLQEQGRYREAVRYLLGFISWAEKSLGDRHALTLRAFNGVALCLRHNGNVSDAEKYGIRSSDGFRDLLGIMDPDTLESMLNLAIIYRTSGQFRKAEALEHEVLQTSNQMLGAEHVTTLHAMSDVASSFLQLEQFREATNLYARILQVQEKVSSPEHLLTLKVIGGLVFSLWRQGRLEKFNKHQRALLEVVRRVQDVEHPDVLKCLDFLARTYQGQELFEEAEELRVERLETHKKLWGNEHHKTLSCMTDLALIHAHRGQSEKTEKLLTSVLEIRTRTLGIENVFTLYSMAESALVHRLRGQFEKAEKLGSEALEISKRLLGIDDSYTLEMMECLAVIYYSQDRVGEAVDLMSACIKKSNVVLGHDHANTKSRTAFLGRWVSRSDQIAPENLPDERLLKPTQVEDGTMDPNKLEIQTGEVALKETRKEHAKMDLKEIISYYLKLAASEVEADACDEPETKSQDSKAQTEATATATCQPRKRISRIPIRTNPKPQISTSTSTSTGLDRV